MNPTSKSVVGVINLLYYSQVMMIVLFSAVVYYLYMTGNITPNPELALIFRYVIIALLLAGISVGYFIFKQQMSAIRSALSLREKLGKYQTAVLIRAACLELPGLFGAVSVLTTGDISFLLFTAIVLVLFVLVRPSTYAIATDLNLTPSERSILENPSSSL